MGGNYDDKFLEETDDHDNLSRILMIVLIVFIMIVSLNSLISFIGDIFDRILEEKKAVLTRIKAECILDLYCLKSGEARKKKEEDYRWTFKLVPIGKINEVSNKYYS